MIVYIVSYEPNQSNIENPASERKYQKSRCMYVCMYAVAAAAVIIVIVLLLGRFVASCVVSLRLFYSNTVCVCVFVWVCVRVFGK